MKRVTITPAILPGFITGLLSKLLAFLLVSIFFSTTYVAAQNAGDDIRVRGTIINTRGEPIQGGSIKIRGKNVGSATNEKGEFSIGVDPRAVLVVSHLGYKTQELPVERRRQINVVLEDSVSNLEEVQ